MANRRRGHLLLAVFARGMLRHLYTRIYFGDEASNAGDPVLALVPADRRATLIAQRMPGNAVYQLDLRLQGDGETVFRGRAESSLRYWAFEQSGLQLTLRPHQFDIRSHSFESSSRKRK
jgi:hypothetical protein